MADQRSEFQLKLCLVGFGERGVVKVEVGLSCLCRGQGGGDLW